MIIAYWVVQLIKICTDVTELNILLLTLHLFHFKSFVMIPLLVYCPMKVLSTQKIKYFLLLMLKSTLFIRFFGSVFKIFRHKNPQSRLGVCGLQAFKIRR